MKKKLIVAAAAAGVVAAAVPAMALENEFHGMYKFMGYQTNFQNGADKNLATSATEHSGWYAEQRARLQYIAKANDNLKLVTHFELDSRFGGLAERYKGTQDGNDGGNLDADQLTLETKNIYLDVNCPVTGTNFKVGLQPWADAYNSIFVLADMTGVTATKAIGPVTAQLGWFRFDDNTVKASTDPGQLTADLIIADAKMAIDKGIKVGATYYNVQNDTGTASPAYELLHMLGANADLTFGPATVKPFVAYQFGEVNATTDISAFAAGAVTKTKVGPGAINFSALYLSGDSDTTGDQKDFKAISAGTTYFNAANMWLLVRSGQAINSSYSVLGNDLGVSGRGLLGLFAGYEGTVDKLFYNANVGWAQAAEKRGAEKKDLGFEVNAQVGYKVYDNLSASAAVAYMALGDGLSGTGAGQINPKGLADAQDPYLFNVQLSYTF